MKTSILNGSVTVLPSNKTVKSEAQAHKKSAPKRKVARWPKLRVQKKHGSLEATFIYKPTRRVCGLRVEIRVSEEQMAQVQELAAHFNMTPRAFLRRLVVGRLPKQPRRSLPKMEGTLGAEHIGFTCLDQNLAARIERGAQARDMTVDEYVADAVARDVDLDEEGMIVHPSTGEVLHGYDDDLYTQVRRETIAPPLGEDASERWRKTIGKQRVTYSVWLEPEQTAHVEYPHMVWDGEKGTEVAFALIPLDLDGIPVLTVDGRDLEPDEEMPAPISPAADGRVQLEPEAAALVRQYLDVTPKNYTATDIVSGLVAYGLKQAFDNQEEAERFVGLDSAEFHDGGWGYVEEEIFEAQQRRSHKPARKSHDFAKAPLSSGSEV